jgi:UDP-glucose 4-epimerase
VRDYLHVLDLAGGHLSALDALTETSTIFSNHPNEACFKAYNLGRGKGMSVYQIIEAMTAVTGHHFPTEVVSRR